MNGEEHTLPLRELLDSGQALFTANWTDQDGAGRPLTKGNGQPLSDRSRPLTGDRAFNRISGPDANSCAGCHNSPHAIAVIPNDSSIERAVLKGEQLFADIAARSATFHMAALPASTALSSAMNRRAVSSG